MLGIAKPSNLYSGNCSKKKQSIIYDISRVGVKLRVSGGELIVIRMVDV